MTWPEPGDRTASWEQAGDLGHTHDPNEVTVQLDGAGRQLEDWLVQQAKDAPGGGQDSDRPVFVDESGRRSRRLRRIGILVGMACAVYAVVIVATLLSGNSNAPWLPVPDQQKDEQPAGKVETSSVPSDSADPSGSASGTPSAGATASDGTTPSAGAGSGPDASGSATAPGASTAPKPSSSSTKPANPGTGTNAPDPDPSTSASNPPDPTTSPGGDPSPDPTESTAGGGSGTVADSSVGDIPVEPSTASSPSPENIL